MPLYDDTTQKETRVQPKREIICWFFGTLAECREPEKCTRKGCPNCVADTPQKDRASV